MIEFVNAKINIGLQIVSKREDGYHNLQTIFYPVGLHTGTPANPESFCDILEVSQLDNPELKFKFTGREVKCAEADNLVCKAAKLFTERAGRNSGVSIRLDKHLPDGAGMGGGSADASFTLKALNQLLPSASRFDDSVLAEMALKLGADCPFFIYNRPMYGSGIGEILHPVDLDLSGLWLVVIKPKVYVSTKEAFSQIRPKRGNIDLQTLSRSNIYEWQGIVKNDFEESIFPLHPELAEIKDTLLEGGAVYASMSGSGSSIYGIFDDKKGAEIVRGKFDDPTTIEGSYLLKL